MEAIDFTSHVQLANHLAKYISSADTIRAHCVRDWGQAPTLQEIMAMQAKHQKRTRAIEEPANGDEMMPRLGSLPIPRDRREPMRTKPVISPEQRQTLWPRWYKPPSKFFELTTLLDSVAGDFGLTRTDLTGERRHKTLVHARAVVIRILKERGWSFPRIGRALGGRDHSTTIHSSQSFDIYAKANPLVGMSYEAHKSAGWCGA